MLAYRHSSQKWVPTFNAKGVPSRVTTSLLYTTACNELLCCSYIARPLFYFWYVMLHRGAHHFIKIIGCGHLLVATTPPRTTVARSLVQSSKHGKGLIIVIKKLNKHSFGKMYLVKAIFLSAFRLKSFIKSLIFEIFFSAWPGKLAQKQAWSVPVQHSIRETDWGLCF